MRFFLRWDVRFVFCRTSSQQEMVPLSPARPRGRSLPVVYLYVTVTWMSAPLVTCPGPVCRCANTRSDGQRQAATFLWRDKAVGCVKAWSDTAARLLMVCLSSHDRPSHNVMTTNCSCNVGLLVEGLSGSALTLLPGDKLRWRYVQTAFCRVSTLSNR